MDFEIKVIRRPGDMVRFEVLGKKDEQPSVLDFMELVKDLKVLESQLVNQAASILKTQYPGMNPSDLREERFEQIMAAAKFTEAKKAGTPSRASEFLKTLADVNLYGETSKTKIVN